jgi:hypothetical protein
MWSEIMNNQADSWRGPSVDGLSISGINMFLNCPHRFWMKYVARVPNSDKFDAPREFGSLFHASLEKQSEQRLQDLALKYPMAAVDIQRWGSIARRMATMYVEHWGVESKQRELYFNCEYPLPDGRITLLHGYLDGFNKSNVLTETKTKGNISADVMQGLEFNLQTMTYLIVMKSRRVIYDLVRRPLGFSCPQRRQKETWHDYEDRLFDGYDGSCEGYPIQKNVGKWFARFSMDITEQDISRFQTACLHPILCRIYDWWDSIKEDPLHPFLSGLHYFRPVGSYDDTVNGGSFPTILLGVS